MIKGFGFMISLFFFTGECLSQNALIDTSSLPSTLIFMYNLARRAQVTWNGVKHDLLSHWMQAPIFSLQMKQVF